MPLIDSFNIDHTIMIAPAVRIAKIMKTSHEDTITVFDLRFCRPNVDMLTECGIHTLEHLLAGFIRNHLNGKDIEVIDISPMGCRTGFYMSLIGYPDEHRVACAWKNSMEDILKVRDQSEIPEINKYQCGSYKLHSLEEAQEIARNVLMHNIRFNHNDTLKLHF